MARRSRSRRAARRAPRWRGDHQQGRRDRSTPGRAGRQPRPTPRPDRARDDGEGHSGQRGDLEAPLARGHRIGPARGDHADVAGAVQVDCRGSPGVSSKRRINDRASWRMNGSSGCVALPCSRVGRAGSAPTPTRTRGMTSARWCRAGLRTTSSRRPTGGSQAARAPKLLFLLAKQFAQLLQVVLVPLPRAAVAFPSCVRYARRGGARAPSRPRQVRRRRSRAQYYHAHRHAGAGHRSRASLPSSAMSRQLGRGMQHQWIHSDSGRAGGAVHHAGSTSGGLRQRPPARLSARSLPPASPRPASATATPTHRRPRWRSYGEDDNRHAEPTSSRGRRHRAARPGAEGRTTTRISHEPYPVSRGERQRAVRRAHAVGLSRRRRARVRPIAPAVVRESNPAGQSVTVTANNRDSARVTSLHMRVDRRHRCAAPTTRSPCAQGWSRARADVAARAAMRSAAIQRCPPTRRAARSASPRSGLRPRRTPGFGAAGGEHRRGSRRPRWTGRLPRRRDGRRPVCTGAWTFGHEVGECAVSRGCWRTSGAAVRYRHGGSGGSAVRTRRTKLVVGLCGRCRRALCGASLDPLRRRVRGRLVVWSSHRLVRTCPVAVSTVRIPRPPRVAASSRSPFCRACAITGGLRKRDRTSIPAPRPRDPYHVRPPHPAPEQAGRGTAELHPPSRSPRHGERRIRSSSPAARRAMAHRPLGGLRGTEAGEGGRPLQCRRNWPAAVCGVHGRRDARPAHRLVVAAPIVQVV